MFGNPMMSYETDLASSSELNSIQSFLPSHVDSKLAQLFSILNFNYLYEKDGSSLQDIFLLFRCRNCLLGKAVGLVEGPILAVKSSDETISDYLIESDQILLQYNETNYIQKNKYDTLCSEKISAIKVTISAESLVVISSEICAVDYTLTTGTTLYLYGDRVKVIDSLFDDQIVIELKSKPALIEAKSGQLTIGFEDDCLVLIRGDNTVFSLDYASRSITFSQATSISCRNSLYKRRERRPIGEKWIKIHSSPPPRITEQNIAIPKDRSIQCVKESANYRPPPTSIGGAAVTAAAVAKHCMSMGNNQQKATFHKLTLNELLEGFAAFKENHQTQNRVNDITDILSKFNNSQLGDENKCEPPRPPKSVPVDKSQGKVRTATECSRVKKEAAVERMKSKSRQAQHFPLVTVDRVQSSAIRLQFKEEERKESLSKYVEFTKRKTVSLRVGDGKTVRSVTIDPVEYEKAVETVSLASLNSEVRDDNLLKMKRNAIHDIQKSIQHLKLINNFIGKHQSSLKSDDKVKEKFEKYRKRLRQQLMKTIDSIERFVNELHGNELDDLGSKQTDNNDQTFFYTVIDKMMKLISSLDYDVFRLISKEIIDCLILISKRFFT